MKKFLLLLIAGMALAACEEAYYYEETGSVFHTYYRIKYQSNRILTAEIDAELQAFNLSLNPFNPNSILAKVNRNEETGVDARFTTVFNKAMEVSEKSGGLFDVTASPLINVWGFGFERKDTVSPHVIDSLKTFVGYRKIRLEGNRTVKDDPRVMLNFSAIAKGYACDVVASLLEREGVENYMIDIGGEVAVRGVNPGGGCWRIGISKPKEDAGFADSDICGTVRLCGKCGLATSGNYRNFYVKDGKKYAHTINPVTGYPSEQAILSATIVAPDCMTADAYATAFMVMGAESACRMAESIPEIEYYIICTGDGDVYDVRYSKGMEPMLMR
ncbi:MAG: FAD:protein FMN transferase [Tannerella sp.]|nr:FAD:protein FMN transferase [Tannerella sp.]